MTDVIRYRARIELPDMIAAFFERITEVGDLTSINHARQVTVGFEQETEDEYELAETVYALREALNSIGFMQTITIERPKKVES